MLDSLHLDCPALERLDCTYCRSLPNGAIAELAAGAPGLNSLVISVCSSIDRPGLLSLRSLRHLTLLDLSYTEVEVRTTMRIQPPARCVQTSHSGCLWSCKQRM